MCEFALPKRHVFPRLVGQGDGDLRRKEKAANRQNMYLGTARVSIGYVQHAIGFASRYVSMADFDGGVGRQAGGKSTPGDDFRVSQLHYTPASFEHGNDLTVFSAAPEIGTRTLNELKLNINGHEQGHNNRPSSLNPYAHRPEVRTNRFMRLVVSCQLLAKS